MMTKKVVTLIAATALLGMAACSATRTQRAPGEQFDDAALLTSVKSALASDPITEDSSKEQAQAVLVAGNVKGVKEVQNDIAVQKANESTGEAIDDSILTAKVKTALIASPDTKAHQINVETKAGVVQMSGFVDSAAAKAAATTVAKSVTGVKDVKNELSVKAY
jgi:hyperosmotically inducible periplasmic protein